MKEFIEKHWLVALGLALGAAAGYIYWLYWGVDAGENSVLTSPVVCTLWSSVFGGLLFSVFRKRD